MAKRSATFPGPVPKEALEFFQKKGLKPGFSYLDVWKEEHSVAFTVAKIMELDILGTLRGTLERALEDGTTFAQFRKDVETLMDRSGWSDYGDEKSKKHRLRVIFDTNMRMAHSKGQWERIERTKSALPYLLYGLGPVKTKHREVHAGWAGLVLPVDDPFWDVAMPQNAYLCACWVRQVGAGEANRLGVDESPKLEMERWEHPKTGAVEMVPKGIHPGFNYNPGKSRTAGVEFAASNAMGKKPPPAAERGKRPLKELDKELIAEKRQAIRLIVSEVGKRLEGLRP